MLEPSSGDLEASLGYVFSDSAMRERALRHPSVGGTDFERLEFLGDAALSLAVGLHSYSRHPDWDEGQLTKMRAALVNNHHLSQVARSIGLHEHLRLSQRIQAEEVEGRGSPVLARAIEALIGAVMLDGGIEGVLKVAETLFDGEGVEGTDHPKSLLQEWMQARNHALPEYRERTREGAVHAPQFEVECVLETPAGRFRGTGRSLKQAETQAARKALEFLASVADQ